MTGVHGTGDRQFGLGLRSRKWPIKTSSGMPCMRKDMQVVATIKTAGPCNKVCQVYLRGTGQL